MTGAASGEQRELLAILPQPPGSWLYIADTGTETATVIHAFLVFTTCECNNCLFFIQLSLNGLHLEAVWRCLPRSFIVSYYI